MSEPDVPAPPDDADLELPERKDGEGSVRVVGTAHVSEKSIEEVETAIEEEDPDVVAVELDEGRYRQLRGETPDDLDAKDLLRGNTVYQFLAYWMLSYVQSRLGDRFDIEPGADMRAAVETAEERGTGVALVDRNIQVTIQRFWARMTLGEKLSTVTALAFGAASPATVAATTALVFGVFFGPLVGIGTALAGVPAATMSRVAAGGVVGLVAAVVAWDLAARVVGEERGLAVGGAVGVAGLAGVALTGVGAATVGNVLGGLVFLVGGGVLGAGVGLVAGSLLGVVLAAGEQEEAEQIDLDDLTDADVVTAMLEEFRRFSPGGAEALIDERDAYIAHHLVTLRDRGYRVVAVVGAGHQQGIERYLRYPEELPSMESLVGRESGSRFSVYRLFGYLFTLGFVAFFVLLVLGGAQDAFLAKLFAAWFLFNGVFAFTLAKLAGARWTSAGVGGAVAWLTSLNPLLAPGWFAGYVELRYTTVNVGDIGRLNEILKDDESPVRDVVSRLFDVPLFRLIMIVAGTNFGSMIASFMFPFVVLPVIAPGGDVGNVADLMLQGARNGWDLLWGLVT